MKTYSYEFTIYLDKEKNDILFKALVENKNNYYIVSLDNGIDKVSKSIFLDLLNGKYKIELIDNQIFKNEKKIKKSTIVLNNNNPLDNLKEFYKIAPKFLGLYVELKSRISK